MNKKLYNLMDWAAIEEIVYTESVHPEKILGAKKTGNNTLIQCYFPKAVSVSIVVTDNKKVYEMEQADEAGFFAVLIPLKSDFKYEYHVMYKGKKKAKVYQEIYKDTLYLDDKKLNSVVNGIAYDQMSVMGSTVKRINGVTGVLFSVYAPNALRVSVLGDFNDFDNSIHQMIKHDENGIFELFVPEAKNGMKYCYEILIKGGEKLIKNDPFSLKMTETEDGVYSVIHSSDSYKWKNTKCKNDKLKIYEISQSLYIKSGDVKAMIKDVLAHVKECGYTYVELMPLFDCYNNSLGFIPTSLFAYDHNVNQIDDIKEFIDTMHANNIGVIIQVPLSSFDNGTAGFGYYDGSCLYEHEDYTKGIDPRSGARIYQYSNAFVRNMLITGVSEMITEFNVDGIKIIDINSMMYLDYYREATGWNPNENGTNENYEGADFIKEINDYIHKKHDVITISDSVINWIDTVKSDSDNLGFDYVLNNDFNARMMNYLSVDPINRKALHNNILNVFNKKIFDKNIISVSHSEVDFGKGGIITRFFGDASQQLNAYKLFMGILQLISGDLSVFMGQDFADYQSFDNDSKIIEIAQLDENQKYAFAFFKGISNLVKNITENEYIEIIEDNRAEENIITFCIKEKKSAKTSIKFFVAINFANCNYDKIKVAVPGLGKYKEIFNSDLGSYGGTDISNKRVLPTKYSDNADISGEIKINMAPVSLCVFEYNEFSTKEKQEIQKRNLERQAVLENRKNNREMLIQEKQKIKLDILKELEKKVAAANKKYTEK